MGVGEVVNVELPRHVDPLGVAASFLPSEPTATQFFVTPIVAQANSIPLKLKAARSRRSRGQRLEPLEAEERRASDPGRTTFARRTASGPSWRGSTHCRGLVGGFGVCIF